MSGLFPGAVQRPLEKIQSQSKIVPRIICLHTMVGSLAGTDSYFHNNGYHGDNAHFGVGGVSDDDHDGAIYQWQDCNYKANAQYSGNAYCISIETSDGGEPNTPWGEKQFAALVDLCVWLCKTYHIPARLVSSTGESGFGYHSQFTDAWNKDHHTCPGTTRLMQIPLLISAVKTRITETTFPVGRDMAVIRFKENGRVYLFNGSNLFWAQTVPQENDFLNACKQETPIDVSRNSFNGFSHTNPVEPKGW